LARRLRREGSLTVAKTSLDLVPQVFGHDCGVLALVDLALLRDPADIDRVRQDLVDMAPADRTTAGRAAGAIDADWKPKALRVETLLEANDAFRLRNVRLTSTPAVCFAQTAVVRDGVANRAKDPAKPA
jgi:hypothetical protein